MDSNKHRADHLFKNGPNDINHTDIPLWDRVSKVFKYISDGAVQIFASKAYVDAQILASALSDWALIQQVASDIKVKQSVSTIGIAGNLTADYNLPGDANMVPANIEIVDIIPANCTLIEAYLKCTTGVVSSGGAITLLSGIGLTSGAADVAADASIAVADEILYKNGSAPVKATAQSLFISDITPNKNWDTLTAGDWVLIVTYLENYILV